MIKVLSFNVWGLPEILFWKLAPNRERRIRAICTELSKPDWDFVLIQEAWMSADRQRLKDCGYKYVLDLDHRDQKLDSGLLILSRHPLVASSAQRLRYRQNGDFMRCLFDGEFFANKSAIMARFLHSEIGEVWVSNTHLVSSGRKRDPYRHQRLDQLRQLTDSVRQKGNDVPFILGGDFNCSPGSEEWTFLLSELGSFTTHQWENLPHSYNPQDQINSSAHLDHILLSPHFEHLETAVQFTHQIDFNGKNFRSSDHIAVETLIRPVLAYDQT